LLFLLCVFHGSLIRLGCLCYQYRLCCFKLNDFYYYNRLQRLILTIGSLVTSGALILLCCLAIAFIAYSQGTWNASKCALLLLPYELLNGPTNLTTNNASLIGYYDNVKNDQTLLLSLQTKLNDPSSDLGVAQNSLSSCPTRTSLDSVLTNVYNTMCSTTNIMNSNNAYISPSTGGTEYSEYCTQFTGNIKPRLLDEADVVIARAVNFGTQLSLFNVI